VPKPLTRNRLAETVAPVYHAANVVSRFHTFSIKPFLKRLAVKQFFEKACAKVIKRF
jgi:hypothetical protein